MVIMSYGIAEGMGAVRTDNSDSDFSVRSGYSTGGVLYEFFNVGDTQNVTVNSVLCVCVYCLFY